jgi:hypothetical protein
MGLGGLISLRPSKCCGKNDGPVRTRLKPRWMEERKIYYASRPAPGSLQMALAPQLRAVGVLMPQNAEASKQEEQKQTWHLVSH